MTDAEFVAQVLRDARAEKRRMGYRDEDGLTVTVPAATCGQHRMLIGRLRRVAPLLLAEGVTVHVETKRTGR